MKKEFINRVELQGIIGSARKYTVGLRAGFQFTLAVNNITKDSDGGAMIETIWVQCSGWESENNDPGILEKGQMIHLTGRLRAQRFTGTDGEERTVTEIIVRSMRKAD